MEERMLFSSAVTTERDLARALQNLVDEICTQMGDSPIDLLMAYVSAHFVYDIRQIVSELQVAFEPGVMLGCTAEGVIGRRQEIESGPAISLIGAHLPGVTLEPFLLQSADPGVMLGDAQEFRRVVGAPEDTRLVITLADPFSTPMGDVLQAFNIAYPGVPVVGGMASGALRTRGNALFMNDRIMDGGLVGVALRGSFEADVVVSQGCRPIWRPFTVQAAHSNVIYNLEGQPPLAWIQELVPELSEEDRALLQNGLFVGVAIDSSQENLGRGDFLIRGVVGIDQQNGAIAIGDSVIEGEKVQFHLRDSLTAREDLEMMLITQGFRETPRGALLFSCNGRGTRLYDYPNADISVIQRNLGSVPLAGFFCAGEVGPVGGKNFMHGHTASLVVFRPQAEAK